MLYTLELGGNEIDGYLEYSYSRWFNRMNNANDTLLKYEIVNGSPRLRNRYYNFDSASGINYIVDVSKPAGDRVEIVSFTDGRRFDYDMKYKVAVNSYRGSGGGGHLIEGAGLDRQELDERLLSATKKDLRYYMIKWFEENDIVRVIQDNNWSVIPETWVEEAKEREYYILFN